MMIGDEWAIVVGIIGLVMIGLLLMLIYNSRGYVTRGELATTERQLKDQVLAERAESKLEFTNVHKRIDAVVETLGPMRGTLISVDARTGRIEDKIDNFVESQMRRQTPPNANKTEE